MSFSVHWTKAAYKKVVELWAFAEDEDRAGVRDAYDRIIARLAEEPESQGESREPGVRIDHEYPLGYCFYVDSVNKKVHVTEVWTYR